MTLLAACAGCSILRRSHVVCGVAEVIPGGFQPCRSLVDPFIPCIVDSRCMSCHALAHDLSARIVSACLHSIDSARPCRWAASISRTNKAGTIWRSLFRSLVGGWWAWPCTLLQVDYRRIKVWRICRARGTGGRSSAPQVAAMCHGGLEVKPPHWVEDRKMCCGW